MSVADNLKLFRESKNLMQKRFILKLS